jgi:hypothetical protein
MRELTVRHPITIVILASVLLTLGTAMIIFQDYFNNALAYPESYGLENYTFGTISSIQNDEDGKPAWIVVGHWKSNLMNNQSAIAGQEEEGNVTTTASSGLDTQIEMTRLDGTADHTHTITNFVLANASQPNNMTKVFNGTSTASLREGPVTDIPTSIRIMGDKVISIWLDPSKIENHFGSTPIYGVIFDDYRTGPPGPLKGNSMQTGNSTMR